MTTAVRCPDAFAESSALASGTRLGRYEIVGLLGAGGMGEVYRAFDTTLGRMVALKTVRPGVLPDEEAARQLGVEARLAASVRHPNIVQIFDVGAFNGLPFIVMELVDGLSLEGRLAMGPVAMPELLALGTALAEALGAAHRRGVVHRDVKPANVLLTTTGRAKVLDFGIARQFTPDAAGDRHAVVPAVGAGTLAYMSPEQALGEPIGPASDVFSAGIVLYRMAAGTLPFTGTTAHQIIGDLLTAEPPPIQRFDLPDEMRHVLARALAKRPEHRYQDGAALAEALAAVAARYPAPLPRVGLAVLPFEDRRAARDRGFVAGEFATEIAALLSRDASFTVVPPGTTATAIDPPVDLRAITAGFDVRYVVHGSLRDDGAALTITARLFDGEHNTTRWAETVTGAREELVAMRARVVQGVRSALAPPSVGGEHPATTTRSTLDREAFDHYVEGRHHLDIGTRADVLMAVSQFEQALVLDGRYAAAHAGRAAAAAAMYEFYDRTAPWLARAEESAVKALMYHATLGEAYAALALVFLDKDRVEDAREAGQRAIELDPSNWIGYWTLGRVNLVVGRPHEAIPLLQRAIAIRPDFYAAYFTLRMACRASGRDAVYRPYLEHLIGEVLPRYLERHPRDSRALNCLGIELATAGRLDEGRARVDQALAMAPDDPMILYATACYESTWGDARRALGLLERAVAAGFANARYLERDPDLLGLHNEPWFAAILDRVRRRTSATA